MKENPEGGQAWGADEKGFQAIVGGGI